MLNSQYRAELRAQKKAAKKAARTAYGKPPKPIYGGFSKFRRAPEQDF
jgi:hypothetical protein